MGGILQKQRIGHKRNFWCQAFGARHRTGTQSGGPGVLAIGGGNRPGSVPGERRLFDGIRMTFVPVTFCGCSWSDPLRAWRLGEKPSSGVPSPGPGDPGVLRKDAKTDGEMRDCPRAFSREGLMIVER